MGSSWEDEAEIIVYAKCNTTKLNYCEFRSYRVDLLFSMLIKSRENNLLLSKMNTQLIKKPVVNGLHIIIPRCKRQSQNAPKCDMYLLNFFPSVEFISRHSAEGKFTFVDQRVSGILGYSPSELLGHQCYEFIHEQELPFMRENFDQGRFSNFFQT